jgi:hypothetical protein
MVMENSFGTMERNTQVGLWMIRKKVSVYSNGEMGVSMKENGKQGNRMGLESIQMRKMGKGQEKDNGNMES